MIPFKSNFGNTQDTINPHTPGTVTVHGPGGPYTAPTVPPRKTSLPSLPRRGSRPIAGYLNLITNMLGFRNNFTKEHMRPYSHPSTSPNPFMDHGVTGAYVNYMNRIRRRPTLANPFEAEI